MTSKTRAWLAMGGALAYDILLSASTAIQGAPSHRMFELGALLVYMLCGFITWKAGGYRNAMLAGLGAGLAVATLGTLTAVLLGTLVEYQPTTLVTEPILGLVFGVAGGSVRNVLNV